MDATTTVHRLAALREKALKAYDEITSKTVIEELKEQVRFNWCGSRG